MLLLPLLPLLPLFPLPSNIRIYGGSDLSTVLTLMSKSSHPYPLSITIDEDFTGGEWVQGELVRDSGGGMAVQYGVG